MPAHWKLPVWVTLVICSALGQVSCDRRGVERVGPLHAEVRNGNLEQVEQLIEQGADVNARTEEGETPLHAALMELPRAIFSARQVEAIRRATPEIITALLQAGARIEARDVRGLTPLQYAVSVGNVDAVRVLVENGANVNTRDPGLQATPLMRAANRAPREILELLLAAGADVRARNRLGSTALHRAAGRLNEQAVEILLDNGADVNAQDDWGSSPLRTALRSLTGGRVAQLLLERGAKHDVFTACALGELDLLRSMLQQDRALLAAKDWEARTPLHWAARWGEVPCADLLLEYGADSDCVDIPGLSPLGLAAAEGRSDVVSFLLERGAHIRQTGWTALHAASAGGHGEAVELLLAAGAEANPRNWADRTPLHGAVLSGSPEVARMLLQDGADVHAKDKDGKTSLAYAQEKGYTDLVELLRQHGATE